MSISLTDDIKIKGDIIPLTAHVLNYQHINDLLEPDEQLATSIVIKDFIKVEILAYYKEIICENKFHLKIIAINAPEYLKNKCNLTKEKEYKKDDILWHKYINSNGRTASFSDREEANNVMIAQFELEVNPDDLSKPELSEEDKETILLQAISQVALSYFKDEMMQRT